jgi:hypothetical protein
MSLTALVFEFDTSSIFGCIYSIKQYENWGLWTFDYPKGRVELCIFDVQLISCKRIQYSTLKISEIGEKLSTDVQKLYRFILFSSRIDLTWLTLIWQTFASFWGLALVSTEILIKLCLRMLLKVADYIVYTFPDDGTIDASVESWYNSIIPTKGKNSIKENMNLLLQYSQFVLQLLLYVHFIINEGFSYFIPFCHYVPHKSF